MAQKKVDYYLLIGIAASLVLAGSFIYFYFSSQPNPADLSSYENVNLASVSLYNSKLDQEMSTLKKVEGLPINIAPSEIGKTNPYNP